MLSKRTFQFNALVHWLAEFPKHHQAIKCVSSLSRELLTYIFILLLIFDADASVSVRVMHIRNMRMLVLQFLVTVQMSMGLA